MTIKKVNGIHINKTELTNAAATNIADSANKPVLYQVMAVFDQQAILKVCNDTLVKTAQ